MGDGVISWLREAEIFLLILLRLQGIRSIYTCTRKANDLGSFRRVLLRIRKNRVEGLIVVHVCALGPGLLECFFPYFTASPGQRLLMA